MNHATTRTKAVSLLLIVAMLSVLVAAIVPFVSTADGDEIQDFGYQAPTSYSMIDAKSNLRFVFSVSAEKVANYTAAGFVFSKTNSTPTLGGSGCSTAESTTVYRSITADGETLDAPPGRFWVAVKLINIPRSYFDGTIYVRAYVTDGEGTRYSDAKVITVWGANAIEYHSNWDSATRSANPYSLNGTTFGVKKEAKSLYTGGERYFPNELNGYAGNDLLVEFSFLYNNTMSNAKDGVLTVMYAQDYNLFNIDLKAGKVSPKLRTEVNDGGDDVLLYELPQAVEHKVSIGYGWHRFGVRIHQEAINDNGVEDYKIIATAYLDGEKIFEVDKTAWVQTKFPSTHKTYTGKLFTLIPYTNRLIYDKITKSCDVYVMVEDIYKSSANAGYLVLQDLSFSCGQTFEQQVTKVVSPASQTYRSPDGTTMTGDVYFTAAAAHDHVWDGDYTLTKAPTLLENGLKAEHCTICGEGRAVAATPSEVVPVVLNGKVSSAPTGWGLGGKFYSQMNSLQAIAKDEGHFYPTNSNPSGNDYLIEFSILWNSTLSGWNHEIDLGNFTGGTTDRSTSWILSDGSIDLSSGDGGVVLYNSGKGIGSNYGWHRIGIRYHQTAEIVDDAVVYTLTYTIYIDGERAYEVIGAAIRYVDQGYRLFDAEIVDGKLVYHDNQDANKEFYWLQLRSFFSTGGSDRYLVLADLMTSAGQDFKQQVEPAASPVASPINLGWYDEELMYYKLAD